VPGTHGDTGDSVNNLRRFYHSFVPAVPSRSVSTARRQSYVEEISALGGIRDHALRRAFAAVPREAFLPRGPWMIEAADGSCYASQDDDPDRILHAVGVVLDPTRFLHSANPARIARALQATKFRPGQTVFHVGAGLGYYSAIMAELVGPTGKVIAAEIDPEFADQARRNLAPWTNVEVVGDALAVDPPALDVLYASCGMATIPGKWLAALGADSRLTFPLTGEARWGFQFALRRRGTTPWFDAKVLSTVLFYPCSGLQQNAAPAALKVALSNGRGPRVRGLRLDAHPVDETCWLHGADCCLTTAKPGIE
jgi:protein-L-isoaspartate(D-aspartate) O-methyltransferase